MDVKLRNLWIVALAISTLIAAGGRGVTVTRPAVPRVTHHARVSARRTSAPVSQDGRTSHAGGAAGGVALTPPGTLSGPGLATAPITASAPMLVVCVAFPGTPATEPISLYQQLYFGAHDSVANYYHTVSYGAFTLSGQAIGNPQQPGQFFTAPQPESFYAGKDNGSGSPFPHNDDGLVVSILKALQQAHFDFSPYVVQGQIPYLALVYSGYGADVSPGNPKLIWPVESALAKPYTVAWTTASGKLEKAVVTNYDLVPELNGPSGRPSTLGVLAHEFGHLLGLDDLYDTSTSANAGQGVGPWSLMGDGNWNGTPAGSSPAELDPFSRLALGWVRPQIVTASVTGLRLPPLELSPTVLELRPATPSTEYFLVSNEQQIGYDKALPESGVLIWRIDGREAVPSSYDWQNDVLNSPRQNRTGRDDVAIMEAGNTGDLHQPYGTVASYDDTYPSIQGNNRFTGQTKPNNLLWNGQTLGIDITKIAVSHSGIATLDIVDRQSGAALVIEPPTDGMKGRVGETLALRILWTQGRQSQNLSAAANVAIVSGGAVVRSHAVTFTGPGLTEVSAAARGLTAYAYFQITAVKRSGPSASHHGLNGRMGFSGRFRLKG